LDPTGKIFQTSGLKSHLESCASWTVYIASNHIRIIIIIIIDIEIPGDGWILKYKGSTIKIQRGRKTKTHMLPVTIGASGAISESFRKYLSNLPGKYIKELEETATLGTAYFLMKVVM